MSEALRVFGLFGDAVQKIVRRDKKPKEICKDIQTFLENLETGKEMENVPAQLTTELEQCVALVYGDSSEGISSHKEPDPKLAKEMIDLLFDNKESGELVAKLISALKAMEFEGRKHFTRIFEYSLTNRRELSVPYIEERPQILLTLVSGYEEKDVSVALSLDAMLRSVILCEELCETLLNVEPSLVSPFFKYIELPSFDINSHAFSTFKLLLTAHPELGANYLRENYDSFFSSLNRLLSSENFLCKVQCFNFLGDLLTCRPNHDSMMKYVNDASNLKLAMIALRGPKAIQLAVFQVLKVFIPNPYKAEGVAKLLTQNRQNFIHFLTEFEKDSKDEALLAHKKEMMEALALLDPANQPLNLSQPASSVDSSEAATADG